MAIRELPWDVLEKTGQDLEFPLRTALFKMGDIAAQDLSDQLSSEAQWFISREQFANDGELQVKISFNKTNPAATGWARDHAAELVKQNLMPNGQETIRGVITGAFERGITVPRTASMIRDSIGILPQHVPAVWKLYDNLVGSGMDPADADKRARGYFDQLLNYRATMIARTEVIRACNQGQQQLWLQAISDQQLREQEWEREWIASDACEICTGLDGTHAPINAPFEGGYMMPPEPHPNCRCAVGLVRVEQPKIAELVGAATREEMTWVDSGSIREAYAQLKDKFYITKVTNNLARDYSKNEQLNILNCVGRNLENVYKFDKMREAYTDVEKGVKFKARLSMLAFDETLSPMGTSTKNAAAYYLQSKKLIRVGKRALNNITTDTLEMAAGDRWGAQVLSKDLGSIIRHEYGHHVELQLMKGRERLKWTRFCNKKGMDYFKKYVSDYAGTNVEEAFAESFNAYTSPLYGTSAKRTLPKDIEDMMKSLVGENK